MSQTSMFGPNDQWADLERWQTLGEDSLPTYHYLVSIRFIADETKTSFTTNDRYNDSVMAVVCGSLMKIACTKIAIIFIPWPMPISNQSKIMRGTTTFFKTKFLMKCLQCFYKFFEKKKKTIQNIKKKGRQYSRSLFFILLNQIKFQFLVSLS